MSISQDYWYRYHRDEFLKKIENEKIGEAIPRIGGGKRDSHIHQPALKNAELGIRNAE